MRHNKVLPIQPPNLKKTPFQQNRFFSRCQLCHVFLPARSHSQPLAATRVAASGRSRQFPQRVAATGRQFPASGRKWPQVAAPSESPQVAASGRKWPLPASGRKWPQVAAFGDFNFHTQSNLPGMFVECIDGQDRAELYRIFPQEIDALGKPECSLKDAAKRSTETDVAWVLTGPRTTKWCLSYLVMEGLGLERHHERFRQLCRVDASAWGIQEHFQLPMITKHALQVDQINAYNAMFCEVIFRRMQTIEFAYAEKARDAESRALGG